MEIVPKICVGERFMTEAYDLARNAFENGEVPVGAVVVHNDIVIARGRNKMRGSGSALLHAEIVALDAAAKLLCKADLSDCTLYTTLEPCGMCAGAIANFNVGTVVFGAFDPQFGCLVSRTCIPDIMEHRLQIIGGVMEKESAELLDCFFKQLRQRKAEREY